MDLRRIPDTCEQWLPEEFKGLQAPEKQQSPLTCTCQNCESESCPCYSNKTICRPNCACPLTCKRRFPPCQCDKSCDSNCQCAVNGVECQKSCRGGFCETGHCFMAHFRRKTPAKTYVSKSQVSGLGLFAKSHIKRHQFLGIYKGQERNHNQGSTTVGVVNLFEISANISIDPTGVEEGIYYINHSSPEDANAEFKYIEASDTRLVIALATQDISPHQEIFASYGCTVNFEPGAVCEQARPKVHEYRWILGIDNKDVHRRWIGKVLAVDTHEVEVQWLFRPSDLPARLKRSLRSNELFMTSGKTLRDKVPLQSVRRVVRVAEGRKDQSTDYWYSRQYSPETGRVKKWKDTGCRKFGSAIGS